MRVLGVLALIAVTVWALVEAVQADARQVRKLPKALWIVLIVLLVPAGPLAWFLFGRPKAAAHAAGAGGPGHPYGRPARETPRPAPDDDPDFLRHLNQQAEQARRLRLLEEAGTTDEPARDPRPEPGEEPDAKS